MSLEARLQKLEWGMRSLGARLASSVGAVSSVFGRTGAVVAAVNDYTWAQINKTTSSIADIATRAIADTTGTLAVARGGTGVTTSTGSTNVVLSDSPTIVTPTIAATGWTNANHIHAAANSGGQLNATNIFSAGTVPTARLGTGTADATTFLRGDQTYAVPSGFDDFAAIRANRQWTNITEGDSVFTMKYDFIVNEMDIQVSATAGNDGTFMRSLDTQWTLSATSRTFRADFNDHTEQATTTVFMSASASATTMLDNTNSIFLFNNGAAAVAASHFRTTSAGVATDTDIIDFNIDAAAVKLEYIGTLTSISCERDDVSIATHTTNLPSVALYLKIGIFHEGNFAGDIDLVTVDFT